MAENHARGYRVPRAGEKEPRADEKEPRVAPLSAERGSFSPIRDTKKVVIGSLGLARGTCGSHGWLFLAWLPESVT